MKQLIYIVFTLISTFLSFTVFAQTDTEFWFVAPEVSQSGGTNLDRPIVFKITTYDQAATVNISQPANTLNQTVNIPANSSQSFNVTTWINTIENKPADSILTYGIKIISTSPITVYYEVISGLNTSSPNNPEAYVLKGSNALGTNFRIPSQNYVPNASAGYSPTPYNSFEIVATENNTSVTINPTANIVGHTANTPFNITLNTGETYSAVATSQAANQHLNGSLVTSNKPIAITVSDDLLFGQLFGGNCADLTGDQIVPIDKLGVKYIAIKGQLSNPGDYIFVTATENNTSITKDGTLLTTINAGATYSFPIGTNNATYIETSQPAYVWQLSGSGCEFGTAILPQIECSGSSKVAYMRSSNYQLYVNILVPNGGQSNFLVNNNPGVITAAQFATVPGTGGAWRYARVLLPLAQYPQNSVINITNSVSRFHLSVLDINGGGTSYSYFSDYDITSITATASAACVGDTLQLNAPLFLGATYSWTGPNNFTSSLQNPTIPNISALNSGWYYLDVDIGSCSGEDSVYVEVYPYPNLQVVPQDTLICDSVSVQLNATGATNYTWSPATYLNNANVSNPISTPSNSITYYVTANINPSCPKTDSVTITVIDLDPPNLIPDTVFCIGDTFILNANSINASSYLWSTNDTTPTISVYQSGQYWVTVEKDGCTKSDTVNVIFYPYPDLQVYPNDTSICNTAPIQLNASGATNYIWTPATFLNFTNIPNPVSTPTSSITYYVTANINPACERTDSVVINLVDLDDPQLIPDTSLCGIDTFVLNPNTQNATSYLWSTNDTTPTISVYQSGQYWVVVQREHCTKSDTVNITFYNAPDLQILNNDTTFCTVTPLQLNAVGVSNYSWSPTNFLNNPNIANPIATPTTTITYYLTGYDHPQCVGYDSITITIENVEVPNLISDTVICEGDTLILNANANAASYLWNTNETTSSIKVFQSGQYWVETFSGDCIGGADTINVTFLEIPNLNMVNSDTTICKNTPILLYATGGNTYRWFPTDYLNNPNIANPIATPSNTITYYVVSSYHDECEAIDSITINVGNPPQLNIEAEDSAIVCEDDGIQLFASGADIYHWRPENLCNDYTISNPIVHPKENTMFIVTGIDEFGCSSTDSIFVKFYDEAFVFVPNAFSPNNDGINDYFYPLINCGIELELFSVYNRFGELVFSTSQPNVGWDGLQNSKPSDVGVYFWYFVGNRNGNKVIKKGDVTLIK